MGTGGRRSNEGGFAGRVLASAQVQSDGALHTNGAATPWLGSCIVDCMRRRHVYEVDSEWMGVVAFVGALEASPKEQRRA